MTNESVDATWTFANGEAALSTCLSRGCTGAPLPLTRPHFFSRNSLLSRAKTSQIS